MRISVVNVDKYNAASNALNSSAEPVLQHLEEGRLRDFDSHEGAKKSGVIQVQSLVGGGDVEGGAALRLEALLAAVVGVARRGWD